MKETKQRKNKVNPDAAVKRGFLKEPYRLFYLNSIEKEIIPPHYHEFHKVIIFISGALSYMVEGKIFKLNPGDMLVIPAHAIHQPIISENLPYKRYVLWLSREAAEQAGTEDFFSECKILGDKKNEVDIDPIINEVIEYINQNLSEELSIEKLCEISFLSKSRLINRFKDVTGYTPHQYIQDKRVIHAAELIKQGMNANVAAEESGFADYSTFYRIFVKAYSQNPGSYG